MKKILLTFFVSTMLTLNVLTPQLVSAKCQNANDAGFFTALRFPTWYKYLEDSQFDADCTINSFEWSTDFWKVALAVLNILLRVAGLVAFGFIIYGGFKFTLSKGNAQEAAKARQTLIDAIIGLGIASLATLIVSYIGRTLIR